MAELEEAVFARLQAVSGVTDLVGTRVHPAPLPQGVGMPAVSYQRVSAVRESAMGSDVGVARVRIEVSSWSTQYSGAKQLATAVRAALQRFRGTSAGVEVLDVFVANDLDLFEEERELHRVLTDFDIWHREA